MMGNKERCGKVKKWISVLLRSIDVVFNTLTVPANLRTN